ncbi:MAG: FeoB-associated Cys-rich membrane protein [Pyramidobacter sp.]|nr:FeoB-associated Cys-rich membrane protein [Pyramidobacter sp.]
MNVWDAVLSLLIFAAVALAAAHIIRVRRSGRSLCGGDCTRCAGGCSRKKNNDATAFR